MKTKYVVAFLLVAITSGVFAGNGADPFRRVYFGFSFTPEVSYRYLVSTVSNSSSYQGIITTENQQTTPQFGANVAAKVGINITHWLAVESGVGYTLAQYRYKPKTFYTSVWNGSSYIVNDSFTMKQKETYHYMTVPIGLRFSMGHRKVRGVIAAGTDLVFLLKKKEVTTKSSVIGETTTSTTVDQTKDFKTFNVSPYLGVGIDCYLSPRVVFRVMPVAQIQALKNTGNTPISEYLWNVGLNVSLLFGL